MGWHTTIRSEPCSFSLDTKTQKTNYNKQLKSNTLQMLESWFLLQKNEGTNKLSFLVLATKPEGLLQYFQFSNTVQQGCKVVFVAFAAIIVGTQTHPNP